MPKGPPREQSRLTEKQKRFCRELVISGKKCHSYTVAFPGTKATTAYVECRRLLKSPLIQAEIRALQDDMRQRASIKGANVVKELAKIAFSDIGDIIDMSDPENPRVKPADQIPAEARHCIQEIHRTQHGVKIKLADKITALDKIARHLGIYKDMPPLEMILAILPAGLRETVREALTATVFAQPGAGGVAAEQPDARPASSGSGVADEDGGVDAGPVAGSVSPLPLEAGGGALHETSGQEPDGGDSGAGPLLD
jgi:phage terminase small subunit